MARRRRGEAISGWINLDKPLGLGSTPAVSRVRRAFDAQKAGHAGTLDPLATGVLPIALGEATKTIPLLADATKTYRFTIAWGAATSTLDTEGEVIERSDVRPPSADAQRALAGFLGETAQVPPAFSAIKVAGERAYDLARDGRPPVLSPRRVHLHRAEVVGEAGPDRLEVEIDCGKGFYVRSLARDLAQALGAVAHVAALRRLRVGPFHAADAIGVASLDALCDKGTALEALLPVETALDDIPALAVTDEDAFRLTQGRSVVLLPRQVETLTPRLSASRSVSALNGGRLVALCEMRAGRLSPVRVFHL